MWLPPGSKPDYGRSGRRGGRGSRRGREPCTRAAVLRSAGAPRFSPWTLPLGSLSTFFMYRQSGRPRGHSLRAEPPSSRGGNGRRSACPAGRRCPPGLTAWCAAGRPAKGNVGSALAPRQAARRGRIQLGHRPTCPPQHRPWRCGPVPLPVVHLPSTLVSAGAPHRTSFPGLCRSGPRAGGRGGGGEGVTEQREGRGLGLPLRAAWRS